MDTVLLEFDEINYTATNLIGDIWNVTLTDLSAGSYNYRWFANDSLGNVNNTETGTYTINKATSQTSLIFDKTSPQTYGASINATCSVIIGEVSAVLYRDGVDVSSENGENIVLGAGTYNYECNYTETQNYTASTNQSTFIINKATPSGTITGTTPITYGTAGDVEGTETNTGDGGCVYKFYRDNVEVSNPDNSVLAAGTYDYVYNTTGCDNYTEVASLDTFTLTINKATTTLNLYLDGTEGDLKEPEPHTINATCYASNTQGDLNLTRNGTQVDYGLSPVNVTETLNSGVYNYTCYYAETQNYTSAIKSYIANITFVDDTPPDLTIDFPTNTTYTINNLSLNVSSTATDIDTWVWSNDSFATNHSFIPNTSIVWEEGQTVLSVGVNDTSGNFNSTSVTFVVDTIPPHITIDHPQNISYNYNNISLNVSANEVITTWIWSNDSGLNNRTFTPNTTIVWEDGKNNITVWGDDAAGNWGNATVLFVVDTIAPPTYVNASPQYIDKGGVVTVNFTVFQDAGVGIGTFVFNITSPNGTETFHSDCVYNGNCTLSIEFGTSDYAGQVGYYNVSVWVNDTLGNWIQNTTWYYVNDTTPPDLTIDFPTNTTYSISNLSLNVSSTASDIDTWIWSNDSFTTNYSFTPNTSIVWEDGQHTLHVGVNDLRIL